MNENTKVVLAKRPTDYPQYDDFKVLSSTIPKLEEGQFLAKNLYLSLDAGFRNWMNESSGDEVLPAMALNQAVMGLTLSRVIESQHSDYAAGDMLMARFAWEQYTVSNGETSLLSWTVNLIFRIAIIWACLVIPGCLLTLV